MANADHFPRGESYFSETGGIDSVIASFPGTLDTGATVAAHEGLAAQLGDITGVSSQPGVPVDDAASEPEAFRSIHIHQPNPLDTDRTTATIRTTASYIDTLRPNEINRDVEPGGVHTLQGGLPRSIGAVTLDSTVILKGGWNWNNIIENKLDERIKFGHQALQNAINSLEQPPLATVDMPDESAGVFSVELREGLKVDQIERVARAVQGTIADLRDVNNLP